MEPGFEDVVFGFWLLCLSRFGKNNSILKIVL